MLAERSESVLFGSASPRIAPPRPLRHGLDEYRLVSASLGIDPMPWQDTAAVYITAIGQDDQLLYREVAAVVSRQQGKTTLVKPLIVARLKAGRHIMHIAQVRELPRIMFEAIADAIEASDPDLFPKRRGKIIWPRRGAGSESIVLTTGGSYRIAAAVTGSARGHSIDDLIIDELREMESFDVVNAAKPAQRFSDDPQTIYLSNAGTDDSIVLNSLRDRAEGDPSLAYLEWSADPEYAPDDHRGWLQANPAIGHYPQVLRDLEKDYLAANLGGNMNGFETESLCRWVKTMRPPLVTADEWQACKVEGSLPRARRRQHIAVSMDPEGARASAAVAWLSDDGFCNLTVLDDVRGDPVDSSVLGDKWRASANVRKVPRVGFDPLTDGELAKFFTKPKSIAGGEFANATSNFVARVKSGKLRWVDSEVVGDDLTWTARKDNDETGSFQAVRANDDRPITAALAAIRAVWLATGLVPAKPRIY